MTSTVSSVSRGPIAWARALGGIGLALVMAACGSDEQPPAATPKPLDRKLAVTGAGSALERLTSDPVTEVHPAISADGKTLLFNVRVYEGKTAKQETLVAIDPNTRAHRTLYTATSSFSDFPAWLPDGTGFAYASNSPGEWSIVRSLTAAPNAAVSVIASGEIAPEPTWPSISPDGKRVAFSAKVHGQLTLAVIDLDGSHLTLLGEGTAPSWSPDGNALVFKRSVAASSQMFLINPETGSELVQLTSGDYQHETPAWSPDGQYIVFSTNRGQNQAADSTRNLYILKRDGTGLTQLTDGTAYNTSPCWGRDNWIYFSSDQGGNFDIWRLRPGGAYAELKPMRAAAINTPPSTPAAKSLSAQPPPTSIVAPPPPAQPAAGCAKDTDCKGDRICEDGACVSPGHKPGGKKR